MDLKHISLIKEDDHGFFVRDARDRSAFRVAKKGLRPETLDQIVKHFAKGGPVRKEDALVYEPPPVVDVTDLANGTNAHVPSNALAPGESMIPALGAMSGSLVDMSGLSPQEKAAKGTDLALQLARTAGPRPEAPSKWSRFATGVADKTDELVNAYRNTLSPASPIAQAIERPPATEDPSGANMTPVNGGVPGVNMTAAPEGGISTPPPPSNAAPMGGQGPGVGGGGVGISGYDKAIADSAKAQGQAAQSLADLTSRASQEQLKAQQEAEARRQAIAKEWETRWQENQAAADRLTNDIATSKIDPQAFWQNKGTGQKIAATLGIILGGIGQAFGGGENQALKLINDAIEKDIDAQKANLGKKQGLLSAYVQKGHSIEEAARLARADQQDALAGQIAMVASKYAGPEAQAKVQALQAGFKKEAYQAREESYLKRAKLGIDAMEARAKLLSAANAGATGPAAQLQKKFQETVTEVQDRRNNIMDALGRLKAAISDKDKSATDASGTWEAFGPHNELLNQDLELIATDMAKLKDPDSVARPAEVEQFKSMLFKPGLGIRNSTALSILDAFQKKVEDTTQNAYRVRGIPPPQMGSAAAGAPSTTEPPVTKNGHTYYKTPQGWVER